MPSDSSQKSPVGPFLAASTPPSIPSLPQASLPTTTRVGGVPPIPWPIEAYIPRGHFKVFEVAERTSRHPARGTTHPFFVISSVDWVNIVPITTDGKVVLVRQWRHGTQEVTLEIPGGMVDAGENAQQAAVRELLEETGFAAGPVRLLGEVSPNPAIQSNRCFTYLARDCWHKQAPHFDGTEQIEIVTVDRQALPQLAAQGQIRHALVMVALYWLALFEAGLLPEVEAPAVTP